MSRFLLLTLAGVTIFGLANMATAQEKRVSPHDSASIDIGGHKITITYGRPYLKGRKMIGGHEPYGKVWRTGADEATTIETDAALDINGLHVPKGKYALFTLFDANSWTLIINKTANQWGAFSYKEADDLGRVKMNVSHPSAPVEQFTITLTPAGGNGATLKLAWENIEASVPVKLAR
jgi:hypothetical protein